MLLITRMLHKCFQLVVGTKINDLEWPLHTLLHYYCGIMQSHFESIALLYVGVSPLR